MEMYGGRPKSGLKKIRSGLPKLKITENKEKVDKVKPKYIVEQAPINPLAQFFDDMSTIQAQARDPNLNKPSIDVGGPLFQAYVGWLRLSEQMKANRKLNEIIKLLKFLTIK